MVRVRLFLIVMAALICQQGTSVAQSLVQTVTPINPPAQSTAGEEASTSSIAIPAGTSVLMTLRSPLHTVSARAGSGLYLETIADVIQQNRIVIPAKSLVQGVVERQARPGRVKGRGELQFHLTTLILPSNYTASIAGSLQSLPGSRLYESRNREGAIQPVDQIDKDAAAIFSSVVVGAALGSISRGAIGAGRGAMIGAAFGIGRALFKRGDDIGLPAGTHVEMVLDRSLTIPLRELAAYMQRSDLPVMQQAPPATTPIQSRERPRTSMTTKNQLDPEIHFDFGLPEVRWW
jgi:hypothetical protein